jgi:CorA-like Mg2+ transporter protein
MKGILTQDGSTTGASQQGIEQAAAGGVIATIFLPLGFLTGFFGQNFAWPIAHLQVGMGYFPFLGVGSEVVAIVLLIILFKRRGWLGSGPTA